MNKRIDNYLRAIEEGRAAAWREFMDHCRADPRALDRALKELRALRLKRGRAALSAAHMIQMRCIVAAGQDAGWKPGEIVETISKVLKLSTVQARRLYDQTRKS